MKLLDLFVIVCIVAVGMFGLFFGLASSSINNPTNTTDTFGHATTNNLTNSTYNMTQTMTKAEIEGAGAGIIVIGACAVLVVLFAFVALSRGKYSKGRYRT